MRKVGGVASVGRVGLTGRRTALLLVLLADTLLIHLVAER